MPSARFLKLKGPKKIKILEAAMKEFLMHPVTMVSINQIIKSAGISRGSFYTYFEDKDDLFQYVAEDFVRRIVDRVITVIKENGGNLFLSANMLFAEGLEREKTSTYAQLYLEVFKDYTFVRLMNEEGARSKENLEKWEELHREIYILSKPVYSFASLEEFTKIFDMIFVLFLQSLIAVKSRRRTEIEAKDILSRQLDIMEMGVRCDIERERERV